LTTHNIEQPHDKLLLLEAALYAAGKPLDLKSIGSFLGLRSRDKIRRIARKLAQRYIEYNGPLEVIELERDKFVMQLQPRFVPRVQRLSIKPTLTRGPLRTLAYIAYNQPVAQSKVVAVRGSHAYRHIRQLEAHDLIVAQKLGKTKILRITDIFLDQFNLSQNRRLMRRQLRSMFNTLQEQNT
jgi:segregation and condensation protein B